MALSNGKQTTLSLKQGRQIDYSSSTSKNFLIWKLHYGEESCIITDYLIWRRVSKDIFQGRTYFARSWDIITEKLLLKLKTLKIHKIFIMPDKLKDVNEDIANKVNQVIDAVKWLIPVIIQECNKTTAVDLIKDVFMEEMKVIAALKIYPWIIPESVLKLIPIIIQKISWNLMTCSSLLYTITSDRCRFKHSIETMLISLRIAWKNWIFWEELLNLWISALLHDVWFSCLPTWLKEKEWLFSESERILVGVHSIIWYLLLSKDETEITPFSVIAWIHHENSEGFEIDNEKSYWKGYGIHTNFSYRLKEQIRIEQDVKNRSDIISVADRYTALRSDRSYRLWFSSSKTLSELILKSHRRQIEPSLVRALADIIMDGKEGILFSPNDEISIAWELLENATMNKNFFWISDKKKLYGTNLIAIILDIDKFNPFFIKCDIKIPLDWGYQKETLWLDISPRKIPILLF